MLRAKRSSTASMIKVLAVVILVLVFGQPTYSLAGTKPAAKKSVKKKKIYVPGEIAIKFKKEASEADKNGVLFLVGQAEQSKLKPEWYIIKITNGMSVEDAVKKMKKQPAVATAEPRYHFYFGKDEPTPTQPKKKKTPVPPPSATPIKSSVKFSKF